MPEEDGEQAEARSTQMEATTALSVASKPMMPSVSANWLAYVTHPKLRKPAWTHMDFRLCQSKAQAQA